MISHKRSWQVSLEKIIKAMRDEPLPVYGDGTNVRDSIHGEGLNCNEKERDMLVVKRMYNASKSHEDVYL